MQAKIYFLTSAFRFCTLMSRFDTFVFGSNPLCSSNVIFVVYISLIISLRVPSCSLSCFDTICKHPDEPHTGVLIESARQGEQRLMHIEATKMDVEHSLP